MGGWVDEYVGIDEEENREKETGSFKRFFNVKAIIDSVYLKNKMI